MGDELNIGVTASASGAITAFDGLAESVKRLDSSLGKLPAQYSEVSEESKKSVVPHRAAHQAMNLVTSQVSELAGASSAAQGPMRVFNDIIFSLATTTKNISMPFIAATVAIVGLSTAISALVRSGEDANKEYEKLLEKVRALAPDSEKAAQATLSQARATLVALEAQLQLEKQTPTMADKAKAAWDSMGQAAKAAASQAGNVVSATINPLRAMQAGADATTASMGKFKDSAMAANPAIAALEKKVKDLQDALRGATRDEQKWREENLKAQTAAIKAKEDYRKTVLDSQLAIDRHFKESSEKSRAFFGLAKNQATEYKQVASTAFQGAANAIGMSFARMVVSGKNFGESAKALFIEVAEQAIARIIAVEIIDKGVQAAKLIIHGTASKGVTAIEAESAAERHAIMSAANTAAVVSFEAVALAGAAAFGSALGPPGSMASMAKEKALFIPLYPMAAAATGMDAMFDKETWLKVGEGGQPERVTVTPASSAGGASAPAFGGGSTYNVSIGNVTLPGIREPKDFVEQLARLVTQRIRGRGDLNMLGKGIA